MTDLCVFSEQHVAAVAALFARVNPDYRWRSQTELEGYFREIFFQNPWRDLGLPSWLAEDSGTAVGFLGVLPRRMLHNGRPIRAAVSCQFMVDPRARTSPLAFRLLQKYLSGPQELSLTDGSNSVSARLWKSAGGQISHLYALHWVRPLRPVSSLLQFIAERRSRAGALARLGLPFAALADACAARLKPFCTRATFREEMLTAASLEAAMRKTTGRIALKPEYTVSSLEWLLAQAGAKSKHGPLHSVLLRDDTGRMAGWFLYYLNRPVSRVLQIGARNDALHAVLEHLFHHARRRGAFAIEGRMEPRFIKVLGDCHCFFHDRGPITLFHSRHPALLDCLNRGEAFFTRLDAEWWMRFLGEASPNRSETAAMARMDYAPA